MPASRASSDIFDVALKDVRVDPPHHSGANAHALRQLHEKRLDDLRHIQEQCAQHPELSTDDFLKLRQSPKREERELGETFYRLYEQPHLVKTPAPEEIVLEWHDDHYEVLGDKDFVWLAKQRGVKHLPARVFGPEKHLARLRLEGAALARAESPRRTERDYEREHDREAREREDRDRKRRER